MPWTSSVFRNCLRILDDRYRRWRRVMYYVFYIALTCIAIYRSRGVPVAKSWCNNHCSSNVCRLLSSLWRAPSLSEGKTTIRKDKKSGCHSEMNLLTKRFVASNVNYASRLRRSSDKKVFEISTGGSRQCQGCFRAKPSIYRGLHTRR